MSRVPIRLLLITVCCLPFVAAQAYASIANLAISVMRETWTGLAGVVSKDSEQVKLPDLLWEIKSAAKRNGDLAIPTPIDPFINRRRAINEPLAKFNVADPVVLQIRGKKIKFESIGSTIRPKRQYRSNRLPYYGAAPRSHARCRDCPMGIEVSLGHAKVVKYGKYGTGKKTSAKKAKRTAAGKGQPVVSLTFIRLAFRPSTTALRLASGCSTRKSRTA
jgi:hypothetical protein